MTEEQAIKFANCLKNNHTIDFNDMDDFCDTVIKALEQQSEDCVNRAEVKNKAIQLWNGDGDIDYKFSILIDYITDLPPVTPMHGTCKDCRYRDPEDKMCECGHTIHWQLPRKDNWYCADFEK